MRDVAPAMPIGMARAFGDGARQAIGDERAIVRALLQQARAFFEQARA